MRIVPAALQSPQRGSERNQPFFIIRRRRDSTFASAAHVSDRFDGPDVLCPKKEVDARLRLNPISASPLSLNPGQARRHKRNNCAVAQQDPRQLKPIPRGTWPLRGLAKRSTAMKSCFRPDSEWSRGSLKPQTHMLGTDSRCSQSNCNPGTDTRYSAENVGASGTTPHRQIVLKRREAYCHLVF